MNWQDWLLIYLFGGVVFVLVRAAQEGDFRDARDTLLSVAVYVIAPFTYAWYRWDKRKREIDRQAHISEGVKNGKYSASEAREWFGWKGE